MRAPVIAMMGLVAAVAMARAEVSFDWFTVDDPGNPADDTGWGSVDHVYRISKCETTNAQYAEFLNAVAATDTHDLYHANMGNPNPGYDGHGGIIRLGSPGSYTYSTIAGREDMPVNHVSFYAALRFANWLHNGQPTGAQDSTTTENGAYEMILEDFEAGWIIAREPGAVISLASNDEWYKAAFYDGQSGSYFDYPGGSDTAMVCAVPGATVNTANCDVVGDLTDVGGYTGSASPHGTFDQGGNLWEWVEGIYFPPDWRYDPPVRIFRGGSFDTGVVPDASTGLVEGSPSDRFWIVGFRVTRLAATCGDGLIEDTEECDDANATPGDGCDASCQVETGWLCVNEPSICTEHSVPGLSPWFQLALTGGLLAVGLGVWRGRVPTRHESS